MRSSLYELKYCNRTKCALNPTTNNDDDPEFSAYIGCTGQDPTSKSFDELHFIYDGPARMTNLISRMSSTFGFGLTESQIQFYIDYPASGAFYVGDPANTETVLRSVFANTAFPIDTASRQVLMDAIVANGGPVVAKGSMINPSFQRQTTHLRATSSEAGENSIDGVPFSDLPLRGLLDKDGFVEVTNNDGVLGGIASIKNEGLLPANINGSQQLWTYEAKGSGIAIKCDPTRTLAGLNKYDVVVKYFQKRYGMTREQAIINFVSLQDVTNTLWTTFIFLPTTSDSINPAIFAVSGIYTPPASKPMWRVAAEETGIRSLSNPNKLLRDYNPVDIAEVFVQAVITPDFVATTKDPFGRLAGLQNFSLNSDVIFCDMIGPVGTPKSYGLYDSVQCIWEYHGGSYSPEIPYAWWRYTSIDVGNGEVPLFNPIGPPPVATDLKKITGPFYVKSQGVWQATGYVNPAIGIGTAIDDIGTEFIGDVVPWSLFQENLNYCYYNIRQQTFADSPLSPFNPTGGKLLLLGSYDCTTGKITQNTGLTFPGLLTGLAIGNQYGLVIGAPLPFTLPNRFPATGPNFVNVNHQYFSAQGCGPFGTNPFLVDPNAPNVLIFNDEWIYFDQQTQKWNAVPSWPLNVPVPGTVPPIKLYGAAQGDSAATAQWRATTLWHAHVPGSMGAASIQDIITRKQWGYY